MANELDPRHSEKQNVLRTIGPIILILGLVFTAVGIGNFFWSFGTFEPPRYFWCAFIGLPLLFIGTSIMGYGYVGAVTRYMAGEVAPVGKDVFNYTVDGTKGSVRDLAAAVGEGLRSGSAIVTCHCSKCGVENSASSNFCKACGGDLTKTKRCVSCGAINDPDARFCAKCGQSVGMA